MSQKLVINAGSVAEGEARPAPEIIAQTPTEIAESAAIGQVAPDAVPKLSLIRTLRTRGTWSDVKLVIASFDEVQREDWDAATMIPRNDPVLLSVASVAGWDAATLDEVFRQASAN